MAKTTVDKSVDKSVDKVKNKNTTVTTDGLGVATCVVGKVEISKMNIYEKLSAITTELGFVAKNLNVQMGKGSYKAVGEADVLAAVKPLEAKYRIYSYPYNRVPIKEDQVTVTTTYENRGAVTKNEKSNVFFRVETSYRFINIDNPSEFIDIKTYGDGVDTQDKAPGKAMTYADKYALLKAYKIQTGDDPDQDGSQNMKFSKPIPVIPSTPAKPVVTSVPAVKAKSTNDQVGTNDFIEPPAGFLRGAEGGKELQEALDQIQVLANTLNTNGVPRIDIAGAVKKHFYDNGKPSANYKKITDIKIANNVISELKTLGKEEGE